MAEDNKFSGYFASRKDVPNDATDEIPADAPPVLEEEVPVREEQSVAVGENPPVAPVRGRGRPRSKSSDPDYQPTTVILRKVTKRRAAHLLEDREMGKDLSELIEELLTEWLERQS